MADHPSAVILDCGTSFCRAGFASEIDTSPSLIIPHIVGTPKCQSSDLSKSYYIGDSAIANRKDLNLRYPVEYGHVSNWDQMQLVWRSLIEELKIQPEDHPFLLAQPCNVSSYNLENTAEFSGRNLTATLSKMLSTNTCSSTEEGMPFDVVNSIKEKFCYCAKYYEEECNSFSREKEKLHIFSDSSGETRSVTIGKEQFLCPESLFKPGLANQEFPGLHEIVLKCFMIEDDKVKSELVSNILLCGGSSLFPGLAPRLQHELEIATAHESNKAINVAVSPYRHAAFQGGKVAAKSENFLDCSMSKEHYFENGPSEMTKLFRR